ncbi:hypothetical protein J3E69DRAFT_381566 [Trichoderma sp. SZMC 28015]
MPSTRKKKDTHEPVIMLSYKDLVRHIKGAPPQQVKKGDPEWEDGIKCIKAYQSQAAFLCWADQVRMRNIIHHFAYVIPPWAKNEPMFHPLMIAHYMGAGRCPSWATFIILKTLYGTDLPEGYVTTIIETFGTAEFNDHTHEYLAIDGAEPAEPDTTEEDHPTSPWQDEDRPDPMAIQVQLSNAVSERQTAEEVGCECTIGNLQQTIDKKLEAMQDALEKKIEEKFAAVREDLERKEKEKFEAQTKELQAVVREAAKFHGEALMRLVDIAWQSPAAPQGADA